MNYKVPTGLLILLFNLFIYAPGLAHAEANLSDRKSDFQQERGIGSIQDSMLELSTSRECLPKCSGQDSCGQFKELSSCLDVGGLKGCFWSCD